LPCKQCGFQIDWEKQTVAQVGTETQDQQELKELRNKDPHVKQVKDWVLSGSRPEFSAISGEGKVLKYLWSQFTSLEINDGILYRRWGDPSKSQKLQAILSLSERRNALQLSHDHRSSGHLDVRKTLAKILAKVTRGCKSIHKGM
jgi:hypothetical protein